jgi:hypothetical protein
VDRRPSLNSCSQPGAMPRRVFRVIKCVCGQDVTLVLAGLDAAECRQCGAGAGFWRPSASFRGPDRGGIRQSPTGLSCAHGQRAA